MTLINCTEKYDSEISVRSTRSHLSLGDVDRSSDAENVRASSSCSTRSLQRFEWVLDQTRSRIDACWLCGVRYTFMSI